MLKPENVTSLIQDAALSDEEVVRRVRGGERALYEVLMRRHNQRVYRAVRAVLGDDSEAEDVMQQAYVSAYAHLEQFAGAARFSTWLIRIALHEAFGRLRRRRPLVDLEREGGDGMDELPTRSPDPEEKASRRELGVLLEAAIDALPELYRTVFVLRQVEELSTAEAAACLEVSEEVIKTRLHRARALLREWLDARVGSAAPRAFEFHAARCDRVVAAVMAKLAA